MSDYLTRLAARALGQAEVVQPRLPSLFEAAPAPALGVARDAPGADTEPPRRARERTARTALDESERRGDESRPGARVDVDARPAIDEPARVDLDGPAFARPETRLATPPPAARYARDDSPLAARGRQAEQFDAPRAARPRRLEPPGAEPPAAPERELGNAAGGRREPEATPLTAGPRPAVVVERPARGDAPSVRVTIGRVEVRAAPPPPPPAPARRAAPRLSLDEYLQLRDEGKR